jgi:hypothetical protein
MLDCIVNRFLGYPIKVYFLILTDSYRLTQRFKRYGNIGSSIDTVAK